MIDDEALIAALKSGRVFAAGLDVFDGEPNLHPEYCDLNNVVLLPHVGSATVETRNAMGFTALDNLDAFFDGKIPINRIRDPGSSRAGEHINQYMNYFGDEIVNPENLW